MKYQLVVFDLDGTLLDTLQDLTNSVNFALSQKGYPLRSKEEIRAFVGNGVRKLVERSLPKNVDITTQNCVFNYFFEHYQQHANDTTQPYDGIKNLLCALQRSGAKVAVVSNKADVAVKSLCQQHFGNLVDIAIGELPNTPTKPAPNTTLLAIEKANCATQSVIYVGDSLVDAQTATNAKLPAILVSWGFGSKEDLLATNYPTVDNAQQLQDLLLG